MNPILASSLVSAGTNLLNRALTPGTQAQETEEPAFSKILNSKSFDLTKYMEEHGLTTKEEVNAHIDMLKGQLLQSPHFHNTPAVHLAPADTQVISQKGGYSLQTPGQQASIPKNSSAHQLAQTIHSLQAWANGQA